MTIKQPQVFDQAKPSGATPDEVRIVDGSPGSLAALRWALSEASLRGVDVHAVGVWESPGGMGYVTSSGHDSPRGALAAALEATVAAATAQTPGGEGLPGGTVTTSIAEGDPARELQRAVGDGDLLVVGSRGHGEVVGLLLNSVTYHVVTRAPCPVVVVPHLAHPEKGTPA